MTETPEIREIPLKDLGLSIKLNTLVRAYLLHVKGLAAKDISSHDLASIPLEHYAQMRGIGVKLMCELRSKLEPLGHNLEWLSDEKIRLIKRNNLEVPREGLEAVGISVFANPVLYKKVRVPRTYGYGYGKTARYNPFSSN